MIKVLHNPNLFSTIFIFSMFMRGSEGVFFSVGYQNSMMYDTLGHCQNLAMCSRDACNVLTMSVMRGLCVLRGRYVGATRAMRVRHTGYVGATCTL
jgi:hypothetical protein